MDKNWLKTRLRMAGKTSGDLATAINRDRAVVSRIMNGHQALSLDQAKQFASALNVEVSELLVKAGLTDEPVAAVFQPGFAESDVTPWARASSERAVTSIAEAFGARPGVDIWHIKGTSMAMSGLLPGDFMLVDTHQSERVAAGDIVLAQVYDRSGSARTILRRWLPPVLVAAPLPGDIEPVHLVDNNNVAIRGKVTASWRVQKT